MVKHIRKKHIKKYAFTLSEVLVTLCIMATTILLVMTSIKQIVPDKDVILTKKAYSTFKNVIAELKADELLYPDKRYFQDTDSVTLEGVTYGGNTKFQKAFYDKLKLYDANESNTCYVYTLTSETPSLTNCHIGADGILWGVPQINFSDSTKHYPITIYPNRKKAKDEADFYKNAVIFATRYDGNIRVLTSHNPAIDCEKKPSSNYMQCRAKEIIRSSNSVKK